MTDQKKTTIPEDIKSALTSLAKGAKQDVGTLVQELKQIIQTDETVKQMPEDAIEHKMRFAFALLARRYTATGAIPVYIRPTMKPRVLISKKGKFYGDLVALVRVIDKDKAGNPVIHEAKLGAGTLFGKSAENMKALDTHKVYKADMYITDASATINNTKIEGYELGGNDIMFAEIADIPMPTNVEFYDNYLKPKEKDLKVSLTELDMNIGAEDNVLDIRMITGMVLESRDGTSPKMGEYGLYELSDASILESGIKGENLTLFVHPSEADYEKGSYLTTIIQLEKWGEGIRANGYMIIPMENARKKVIQPKPVSAQQSVDVNLDDTEHKKLEQSVDDNFTL